MILFQDIFIDEAGLMDKLRKRPGVNDTPNFLNPSENFHFKLRAHNFSMNHGA